MNITYILNKSPDFVFDYLTDMDKFVSIHPVISNMRKLGTDTYKVYETLKFGFIPCSFTYPATVEGDYPNMLVVMKAVVMGVNKINIQFNITETLGQTRVDEEVLFETFLPIKGWMRKVFKRQHAQFFKNLEAL